MEWYLALGLLVGSIMVLMAVGMPDRAKASNWRCLSASPAFSNPRTSSLGGAVLSWRAIASCGYADRPSEMPPGPYDQ